MGLSTTGGFFTALAALKHGYPYMAELAVNPSAIERAKEHQIKVLAGSPSQIGHALKLMKEHGLQISTLEEVRVAGSSPSKKLVSLIHKELGVPVKTGSEAEADKLIKEAMSEAKKLKGGGDRGTGKGLLQRAIERLSKPQVNWKNELRRIVGKITSGSEEYFGKRKHLYRGEYFYGDRDADSDRLKEAVVAVDTSGSIGDDQLVAFLTEITAIIKAKQIKKTEIIYFDYGITGRDIVKNPPKFDIKQAKGGGGTSFIDPMNAIYEKWKKGKLELAVFFTDGYGDQGSAEFEAIIKKMKKFERSFIWLVIDNPGFVAPFGKVIHAKAVK
jgi:hypothetical protein